MAVSQDEDICTFLYQCLVKIAGYQLLRVSNIAETEARIIWPQVKDIISSGVELNDGSWECCLPVSNISEFCGVVRKVLSAEIDLNYNPFRILRKDREYFGFQTAWYLNRDWLQKRAATIGGEFYTALHHISTLSATGREAQQLAKRSLA